MSADTLQTIMRQPCWRTFVQHVSGLAKKPKAKSQKPKASRDSSDVFEQIHWLWRRSLTFPPLRRVTFWQTPQKVTKKGWLLSYGPYAALRGSLAPALLPGGPRPRPIHGPKRLPGILPVTSLRKTSTRPPEVAICVVWTIARLKAKAEQSTEQRQS